jgi:CRISPR/Cas system Type II protein with McrA/HNH and RuvC-like nuclease domain
MLIQKNGLKGVAVEKITNKRESHDFRISMRERLFEVQNGICVYCKKKIVGKPSLDHVIPLNLGGGSYDENFVVCHTQCNKNKLDYIVFSSLEDKEIYPLIDVPYFFKVSYIQTNKFKEN